MSSNKRITSEEKKGNESSRKRRRKRPATASRVWTYEERCRLAEAIESGKGVRFPYFVSKYVGTTKEMEDIKRYREYYRLVEQGMPFPAFKDKAALDAWIELSDNAVRADDKSAEQCIPQLLTVAALEPVSSQQINNSPNYANVYNFLSTILKGDDPPDLPPMDAHVTLTMLDGLVDKLANSITMLQKEFLHQAFGVLSKQQPNIASQDRAATAEPSISESERTKSAGQGTSTEPSNGAAAVLDSRQKHFPSLNPLNVPFKLLEFRKKKPVSLDLAVKWKTVI